MSNPMVMKRKDVRWGTDEAGSNIDIVLWKGSNLGRDVIR